MDGLNSNLNLNEGAPSRVMPRIGEWGPLEVPATRAKRRMRWWVILITFGVTAVTVGYGYWIYTMIR
ncbi:MAG: hypothetical protein QM628_05790 [Propionicimonas sp.]